MIEATKFNEPAVKRQTQLLRHLTFLALTSAVLASALIYPLRVPNLILASWDAAADVARAKWGNIYLGQLRSFVAFNHSPLVMKECVSSAFIISSICFASLYIIRTIGIQIAVGDKTVSGSRSASHLLRSSPLVWLLGFLCFSAVSALTWSPTPHFSLKTALLCGLGIGAFGVVCGLRPTWAEAQKFMVAVALAGVFVAWISFLQHIEAAWWFLPKFDDPRNRVGSLIGHNTGLSAYLLFPLSFSISFWFIARRLVTRVVVAVAIILILFVLVAAQSRAIWPIGTLMVAAQSALILRGLGRRLPIVSVLGVVVALFVTFAAIQTVAPEVNPLARHTVRITERLRRDFSPQQLIKETRLRILVVSLPLIAKSPLWGHGIGSFQYVYPPAHGEYFSRNPDSVLGTTIRRTDVAHNDYLQLVVELGLIGAVLALVAAVLTVRSIYRGFATLPWGRDKILLTGLISPCGAIAIHAFFDFPFHIHPIALTCVTTLAFAYVLTKRVVTRENDCTCAASTYALLSVASDKSDHLSKPNKAIAPGPPLRLRMIGALVGVAAAWLASPLVYEFILREFISDTLHSDATNWVATARAYSNAPGDAKYTPLGFAKELYRRAIKVNVFNAEAIEGLASAYLLEGTFDVALWRELSSRGADTKVVGAIRQNASRNLLSAVEYAKTLIERGELRYHYVFYVMGQAYHLLAKLNPEKGEYLDSARLAFERAIALNNADVGSLQELADVYEEMSPPDYVRSQALRRRIFEVDPEFAARRYIAPVDEAARRGRFAQAWQALNKVIDATGDHWSVQFAKARLYLKEALWPPPALDVATTSSEARQWFESRFSLAKNITESLIPTLRNNQVFERFRLMLLAAGGETTQALELADTLLQKSEQRDPELDVLRYELGSKLGKSVSLRWVEQGSAEFWYHRQRLRTLYLGPVALGSGQLANMVRNDANTPLDIDEGLRAIAYLRAAGQHDLAKVLIEKLAVSNPNDPEVQKLLHDMTDKPRF
ncbi:MAG: O-antigen ligase family protein [Candidatus Sumerlaeaceae bacterium]|nr:O-antigen ligase family protein [Candidatus Sumerlaeaceae bacterium]